MLTMKACDEMIANCGGGNQLGRGEMNIKGTLTEGQNARPVYGLQQT